MRRRRAWRAVADCHGRDKRGAACPSTDSRSADSRPESREHRCRSLARWIRGFGQRGE